MFILSYVRRYSVKAIAVILLAMFVYLGFVEATDRFSSWLNDQAVNYTVFADRGF